MYYNDYEDYMRNVLGYSNMNNNTYPRYDNNCNDMNCNNMNYNNMGYNNTNYSNMNYNNMPINQFQDRNVDAATIEQMYPEIYKIINPMVCRMCDNNTQPITEFLVEQMTDDIYDNVVNRVEIQNVINVNIGTRESDLDISVEEENNRSTNTNTSSRNNSGSLNNNSVNSSNNKTQDIQEENRETRSPLSQNQQRRRNRLLRDLIRILILNRLLRRNRFPSRPGSNLGPGMPGQGPRPLMPRMDNGYPPFM